jgi:hypothetical protein
MEFEPVHAAAFEAALRDPGLYERLVLVDALRAGDARLRNLAHDELRTRLAGASIAGYRTARAGRVRSRPAAREGGVPRRRCDRPLDHWPAAPPPRPTRDVDVIVEVVSLGDYYPRFKRRELRPPLRNPSGTLLKLITDSADAIGAVIIIRVRTTVTNP